MKKLNKRVIAGILTICVAITATISYLAYNSYAARQIDESKTVSFAQFSTRHEVPETTIFIGTHLIKLEAATDELWEQALESQNQSSQANIYYKSELAGGMWYDITDAESLMDINGQGNATPVSEDDLAELRVMYYTFDYGITRLAINDGRHCIFDGDYDYWDLYHLSELESIKNQYEMIVSRNNENSRMDKFYRDFLANFFNKDLRNSVTEKADDALYALQDIYDALVDADRKDDADIIYRLMAKLDNARRAEIFRQLVDEAEVNDYPVADADNPLPSENDTEPPSPSRTYNNLLDELVQKAGGTGFDAGEDEFITNYDVVDAIGDSTEECQTAYLEKSNDTLQADGFRIIDNLIYDISMKIINNADGGLTEEMSTDIARLGHLFNIDDEKIKHQDEELAIIDNELLGPVTDKFAGKAMASPSEEYKTALSAGVSESALSGLLDVQEVDVDNARLELQDVIKAKTDRMPVDEAMAFTYDRINLTQDMINHVPATDFKANATLQLKRHLKWLQDLLAELYARADTGDSELDKLQNEADNLLLRAQKALDNNDLAGAKELMAARDAALDKIDGLMSNLREIINDPNANAGDKALAQSILDGSNGIDQLIQSIVNDALEKLAEGEDISDVVDLLSALGATDGLNQLGIEDDGGDGGDGNDGSGGLSEDDLLNLLAGLLGDIDSLSPEMLACAIRAMEILYDEGYSVAGSLAARLANIARTKGNKYVYSQINDSGSFEYVNIYTLAKVADYRWVHDNSKRTNALIGTGTKPVYHFAAGDDHLYEVVNRDTTNPILKELTTMQDKVRMSSNLFATVEVVSQYFDAVACHIKKSSLGVCITSKMEGEARNLHDQLLALIQAAS